MKTYHKVLEHMVPLRYNCYIYGDQFQIETDLTHHLQSVCTSALCYGNTTTKCANKCFVCNHPYNTRQENVKHMKIHFVDSPYICFCCSMRFAKWRFLKKHACTSLPSSSSNSSCHLPSASHSLEPSPSCRVSNSLPPASINKMCNPLQSTSDFSRPQPSSSVIGRSITVSQWYNDFPIVDIVSNFSSSIVSRP